MLIRHLEISIFPMEMRRADFNLLLHSFFLMGFWGFGVLGEGVVVVVVVVDCAYFVF